MTISEDVQSITFHNYRPLIAHLYVGPFIALYGVWAAVFLQVRLNSKRKINNSRRIIYVIIHS